MKRKYVKKILVIINLFLILSFSLTTLTIANLKLSTSDNITDSVGDVIVVNSYERNWKPTDLHSELDINTMIRSSQVFTITFHEQILTETNYQYSLGIWILEDDPEYTVSFMMDLYAYIPSFVAELEGPEGYWNGTGWEWYGLNAVNVGTILDDEIEINIPAAALSIQSSYDWGFMAVFTDFSINSTFVDFCPNKLRDDLLVGYSGPSDAIYGFEITFLLGITTIFTIILIYKYKKIIKKRF